MANKKSFWYRLGKAWENKEEVFAEVFGDGSLIGTTPESMTGLVLGEKLNDVIQWIADNWSTEEIEEFFGEVPIGQTPEAYIGVKLGEGLAGAADNFKAGVEDQRYEGLSPDEKDALREEEAKLSEAKKLPPTVSKEEIESQMGAAFEKDTTIQTAGMAGLPQEEIARAPIGRLEGDQYEAYASLVTEQGMTPEQAYQRITGQNLAGFVTDVNGDIVFEKLGDKFVPVPVTAQPDSLFMVNFVDHIARQNPEAINELKSFLVTMGVAEEEDFDDSGEMDNNLRGILSQLMENANYKYSHVMYGSNEYQDLANTVPRNFGWVEDTDMTVEKVSWALLGRAIMDYKTDSQFIEDADVRAKEKEFEQIKDIPSSAYMARRIDAIFEEEVRRPPTDEERNKYINDWNSQYDNWAQNQAYAYRAATYGAEMENYLIENGKAITAEEKQEMRGDIQAGGDVLTGIVGTREKEVIKRDDEDIKEEIYYQIEQDLKSEADYIEAGKNKRTHQSNLIGLMTGRL